MRHRMLSFYILSPSVFTLVSALSFHPVSGMMGATDVDEDQKRALKGPRKAPTPSGIPSPILEAEEGTDTFVYVSQAESLLDPLSLNPNPTPIEEIFTLADIKNALNYSPQDKELVETPRVRVDYQKYVESLMIKLMTHTGWKIEPAGRLSSSYFYADESSVSNALKNERTRLLRLKSHDAQKSKVFIAQLEKLERFIKNNKEVASASEDLLPSLLPENIQKTSGWTSTYMTHTTQLPLLVAPNDIENTIEILGLLHTAFEKLQRVYDEIKITSLKVLNPILETRFLLKQDKDSTLTAWGNLLLTINKTHYEKAASEPDSPLAEAKAKRFEEWDTSSFDDADIFGSAGGSHKDAKTLSNDSVSATQALPFTLPSFSLDSTPNIPVPSSRDKLLQEASFLTPTPKGEQPSSPIKAESEGSDSDSDGFDWEAISAGMATEMEQSFRPQNESKTTSPILQSLRTSPVLEDTEQPSLASNSSESDEFHNVETPDTLTQEDIFSPGFDSLSPQTPKDSKSSRKDSGFPENNTPFRDDDNTDFEFIPTISEEVFTPSEADRSLVASPVVVNQESEGPKPPLETTALTVENTSADENDFHSIEVAEDAPAPEAVLPLSDADRALAASPVVLDQDLENTNPPLETTTPLVEDTSGDDVSGFHTVETTDARTPEDRSLTASPVVVEEASAKKETVSRASSPIEGLEAPNAMEKETVFVSLEDPNTLLSKISQLEEAVRKAEAQLTEQETSQTKLAIEGLFIGIIDPIEKMIRNFQEDVVAPLLKKLEEISQYPEYEDHQSAFTTIKETLVTLKEDGLNAIQLVIDTFRSTFQENKAAAVPTTQLALAQDFVHKIIEAFKNSKAALDLTQKPIVSSDRLPLSVVGPESLQRTQPLSFALVPQESTLPSATVQTTPLKISPLGSSSSRSGSTAAGTSNGASPIIPVNVQIQNLSTATKAIPAVIKAWQAQMNTRIQMVQDESAQKVKAARGSVKITRRRMGDETTGNLLVGAMPT